MHTSTTIPPMDDDDRSSCDIALNRIETTILTPNGDVLVCRGRDSEFVHQEMRSVWQQNVEEMPLQSALCADFEDAQICCAVGSTADDVVYTAPPRAGLLGGAAPQKPNKMIEMNGGSSFPRDNSLDGLAAIPSFDYSHHEATSVSPEKPRRTLLQISENEEAKASPTSSAAGLSTFFGSLLSPSEPEKDSRPIVILQSKVVTPESLVPPSVMHGVPTCLPGLSEIHVTHISAHPLGSHVLLISSDALLFSYGLNDCGQLGLGTPETFVRTPTLVTAVLEGGGKTVTCSAGVDNSLIVVKTLDRRVRSRNAAVNLHRVTSSPPRLDQAKSEEGEGRAPDDVMMYHHQVYGFGSNASNKLGLVNSDENANLSLPHRVALHAKVWPEAAKSLPMSGVFQVATSVNHSAALVRRGTGSIEMYTWGEPRFHALGEEVSASALRGESVAFPTKVEALSYRPPSSENGEDSISYLQESEYPAKLTLGPNCTFVITNTGRCLSIGTNENGLLGLGKASESAPTAIPFPNDGPISSVSVGAQHALATSVSGHVYSWGHDPASKRTTSRPVQVAFLPTTKAAAGFDSSAFVSRSGIVHTCGLKSGRLGQGEVPPNPKLPTPLFGGLRLWREGEAVEQT